MNEKSPDRLWLRRMLSIMGYVSFGMVWLLGVCVLFVSALAAFNAIVGSK